MNRTLLMRELKGSIRLLLIVGAVTTLYVTLIIGMYDPKMMAFLDGLVNAMPRVMAAFGMRAGNTSLLGFMISYLYGFILILFPMAFSILRGNALIAKHVDRGSMVTLLAAPVKRVTIALTQMAVLLIGILLLVAYATGLELIVAQSLFPGELVAHEVLKLNGALLCLHLFIGGICYAASCLFSDTRNSLTFGAGIPILMYILQMASGLGEKTEKLKGFTFFSLFDARGLASDAPRAGLGALALLIGAIALYGTGTVVFCKKDLHI